MRETFGNMPMTKPKRARRHEWMGWVTQQVADAPPDECWEWPFGMHSDGYGAARFRGRNLTAHHAVLEFVSGEEAQPGTHACHTCDNRTCVNPRHVYMGTASDNNKDMRDRRRHCHGAEHHATKLTDEEVREIRRSTAKQSELAARYGVTQGTISRLKNGVRRAIVNQKAEV